MKTLISSTVFLFVCCASLRAQDDSERVVRADRARVDSVYAKTIERHRCIKAYLTSPLKGDPKVEHLLLFLLQNGFSIEDLDKAFFALRAPVGRPTASPGLRESMLGQGAVHARELADLERENERIQRRKVVQLLTGVEDESVLGKLLAFAPASPAAHEIAALRVGVPVEGERLLKDDDWMTEDHRRAVASYKGERRAMFPKPIPGDPIEMKPFLAPRANLPGPRLPRPSPSASPQLHTPDKF